MNELVELLDELQKKQKQTPFCVENCFRQGKIRIQSTHSAKSAMPMAFPSMKWILPWQVNEFTQKSNAAPMAAEKIPRRLNGEDDFYELISGSVRKYMIFCEECKY